MRLLQRALLVPLVLCGIITFAVEPTTSTQFDVAEGRGVVVVHARSQPAPAHTSLEQPTGSARAVLRTALVLALLLLRPLATRHPGDVEPGRERPASRWRGPVLRAPPALV